MEHFILLLEETDALSVHLRRTVARVAGYKLEADYGRSMPERPHPDDLPYPYGQKT
jgi:hypothetical protein